MSVAKSAEKVGNRSWIARIDRRSCRSDANLYKSLMHRWIWHQFSESESNSAAESASSQSSLSSVNRRLSVAMGFDIPEPFCWDDSFKVFYEQIDEEHKGLFKGIFDVSKSPSDAGALDHLRKVVGDHFSHEEGIMEKANYAEIGPHKQLHADFVAKLKGLSVPVSNDTVHFAKDWLVNHIKTTDFKYKGKL